MKIMVTQEGKKAIRSMRDSKPAIRLTVEGFG